MNRRQSQQLKFSDPRMKRMLSYGGTLRKKAKNRGARPISTKNPMHLCLKSSQAVGQWSFHQPRNWQLIQELVRHHCRKNGIKLIEFANAGNHLHLLIKAGNRQTYLRFIKALCGAIALKITGSNKFQALAKGFWDYRPFTRVIESLRGFLTAKDYLLLNQLEAVGIISYQPYRLKTVDRSLLRRWGERLKS